MRRALLPLLLAFSAPALAQPAAPQAPAQQICWALAEPEQSAAEVAQRIAEERCQRGDALVILGHGIDTLALAASFCDLTRPVTLQDRAEGGQVLRSLLCLYAGQHRLGRNGRERPRGR